MLAVARWQSSVAELQRLLVVVLSEGREGAEARALHYLEKTISLTASSGTSPQQKDISASPPKVSPSSRA